MESNQGNILLLDDAWRNQGLELIEINKASPLDAQLVQLYTGLALRQIFTHQDAPEERGDKDLIREYAVELRKSLPKLGEPEALKASEIHAETIWNLILVHADRTQKIIEAIGHKATAQALQKGNSPNLFEKAIDDAFKEEIAQHSGELAATILKQITQR